MCVGGDLCVMSSVFKVQEIIALGDICFIKVKAKKKKKGKNEKKGGSSLISNT